MIRFEKQHLVRVIYKGGAVIEFWAAEFSHKAGLWKWDARGPVNPIVLGPDEIAAVYRLRGRYRLRLGWRAAK